MNGEHVASKEALERVCDEIRNLGRGPKVLYVEDDRDDFHLLQQEIKPYAVELDQAVDAESATAALLSTQYDLVFLDLSLKCPGNGIGVLTCIKSLNRRVPVVALTGADLDGKIAKSAHAAGVEAVMQKPLSETQARMLFSPIGRSAL